MHSTPAGLDPASFRDPSGFVFRGDDGLVYRQVNSVYEPQFQLLMESGLYQELSDANLMVAHQEVSSPSQGSCRIIRPDQVEFISYPYEWCFSQYQDAALLTLDVQRRALGCGMILKDASAYNIVFNRGRPLFIDTLSFERYEPGSPWVAYGQFCSHFLAPLALMSLTDIRLQRLMETSIDGIPLDLAARLLPRRARLRPGLFMHLFLHAWMQRRFADTANDPAKPATRRRVSETGAYGMIDGLKSLVRKLTWNPTGTEWADYYATNSYDDHSAAEKQQIIGELLDRAEPKTAWDLGANTGVFGRIAADKGIRTIAFDIDPACVEVCYQESRREKEQNLLCLRSDLTNPSPAIGWAHQERRSLVDRGPVDLVMMLALVHHLAISNNVPLARIAEFARSLCTHLIIEFVPKHDPQVQRLLRTREDIFSNYTQDAFEKDFGAFFSIVESRPVGRDGRVLYLLKGRES